MYSFWFIFTGFWFIFTENFRSKTYFQSRWWLFGCSWKCICIRKWWVFCRNQSPYCERACTACCYLSDSNLKKGLNSARMDGHTKKAFAMYSNEYVPGNMLTDDTIQKIFEDEVMKITKHGHLANGESKCACRSSQAHWAMGWSHRHVKGSCTFLKRRWSACYNVDINTTWCESELLGSKPLCAIFTLPPHSR